MVCETAPIVLPLFHTGVKQPPLSSPCFTQSLEIASSHPVLVSGEMGEMGQRLLAYHHLKTREVRDLYIDL